MIIISILIRDLKEEERPRERLLRYGKESLSVEELIAIVLKCGTKNKSVKAMAREVLALIDNIFQLEELSVNRLTEIKGIGVSKAVELIGAIELGRRIFLEKYKEKKKYDSPYRIYKDNKQLFFNIKQERFYCLYLNTKFELIERKLLFMGTVNQSIVHPREVFKHAYLYSASNIICMHNHPSGDIMPSKDDIVFTNALVEIGKIQNIPIVDHVIMGDDDYYSFKENNLMKI